MRNLIAELLAAWSSRLLTWSNNIALLDYQRGRHEQGVI
jgi:hypothetical protein